MGLVIFLVLINLAFGAFFLYLFYHVNKLEKKMSYTLQQVEIYLLDQYGEVNAKRIQEVKLED